MQLIIECTEQTYSECKKISGLSETAFVIAHGIPYDTTGDLVSREVVKGLISDRSIPIKFEEEKRGDWQHSSGVLLSDIYKAIDKAPTVVVNCKDCDGYEAGYSAGVRDTERPHGAWINHRNDSGHNIADCSLCGKTMQWHDEDEDGVPRYCWYCGAAMKGSAE